MTMALDSLWFGWRLGADGVKSMALGSLWFGSRSEVVSGSELVLGVQITYLHNADVTKSGLRSPPWLGAEPLGLFREAGPRWRLLDLVRCMVHS